jgi:hypothetical protein
MTLLKRYESRFKQYSWLLRTFFFLRWISLPPLLKKRLPLSPSMNNIQRLLRLLYEHLNSEIEWVLIYQTHIFNFHFSVLTVFRQLSCRNNEVYLLFLFLLNFISNRLFLSIFYLYLLNYDFFVLQLLNLRFINICTLIQFVVVNPTLFVKVDHIKFGLRVFKPHWDCWIASIHLIILLYHVNKLFSMYSVFFLFKVE